MLYYEIIFETGNKSVISAENDDEALSGIQAHHERATKGEPGRGQSTPRMDLGPETPVVMDYPAERVSRVLVYEKHPALYNEDQTMSADVLSKEVTTALKGKDVVSLQEVAADIRALSDPHVPMMESRLDSQYKMEELRELELPWMKGE